MKFANIRMQRTGLNNLGDNIQTIAIDNLYSYMGIPLEDIVRIDYYDLDTYQGEYVVLPINYPFYGYKENMKITMFSDYIIPVFLGVSFIDAEMDIQEREYIKHYEPVGCRDEYTMQALRRQGIAAYLNGCMTITLPKRTSNGGGKVFFVDVPEKLYPYIPEQLVKESIKISQMVFNANADETAKLYLERYAAEARLVVTTRLHCAVPCLAAGIPVVLLKENYSFRFPWLKKFIPIYTGKKLNEIDWNPQSYNLEDYKIKILENAKKQVMYAFQKYSGIFDISSFLECNDTEVTIEHYSVAEKYILNNWNTEKEINYSFWGVTQTANLIYKFISRKYPNAKLVYVYDKYKQGHFKENQIRNSALIKHDQDTFVFVTSASAYAEAEECFKSINKKNYLQCSGDDVL